MKKQPARKSQICIRNLSHRFADGTLGIDRIDLSINAGELVVIAGPNGSGKSTLLLHINALLMPTAGKIEIDGVDAICDPAAARNRAGIVFQNADNQIVGETVYEDVAFGPQNQKLTALRVKSCTTQALRAVGLTHLRNQRPHLLSGGEKRKLAIAGVLAMGPSILMLDEPFAGLDYPGIRQVLRQIVTLHRAGYTILITTHDLEKIIAHADRLVIMYQGRIKGDGRPEALLGCVEQFGIRQPCSFRWGRPLTSWLN